MASFDGKALMEEIRANHAKLKSCARHRFEDSEAKFGMKVTCVKCGGTMRLEAVSYYIEGYEAAGKDAADIWPAWAK